MPKPKKDPKQKPQATSTPTPATAAATAAPNWPPLRPLVPPADLTLTPLLDDQIYLIPNFLTATLCKSYVSFLASLPLSTTPGRPKKDEAVRVNDRFQIEDASFAERLWETTALKEIVMDARIDGDEGGYGDNDRGDEGSEKALRLWGGKPLGLNSNIRVYRYSPGQFFAQHYDDSNTLTYKPPKSHTATPARTTWTLLVYLSACSGGETVFYPEPTRQNRNPEPVSVAPEMGMALLHRHGDQCLLHEGKEVCEGEKWVLRSDLIVAR